MRPEKMLKYIGMGIKDGWARLKFIFHLEFNNPISPPRVFELGGLKGGQKY